MPHRLGVSRVGTTGKNNILSYLFGGAKPSTRCVKDRKKQGSEADSGCLRSRGVGKYKKAPTKTASLVEWFEISLVFVCLLGVL